MNKLFILLLLAVTNSAFGQYVSHYEKEALTSFYSKDYEAALLFSEKVIEAEPLNVSSLFVAGESARLLEDLSKAESYLERIPDGAKVGYYAMIDYRLGAVKHELEKPNEAKAYYAKYLSHHNQENDMYAYLAEQAMGDIVAGINKRRRDLIEMERLGDNINTDLSELAPLRYADKLYFTTIDEDNFVKKNKKGKKFVRRPVTRIYEAKFNGTSRPIAINPKKATMNASNVALMPDASRMYYTLCEDEDYRNQKECEIWYRERQYGGEWGPAIKLPPHINMRGHTATQPSIGYDKNLGRYVLYFVSDRPGGKGGMDIWASTMDWMGQRFDEPVNISMNTEGDEATPFFHQSSQTFFFSSNGLGTYGGLDIFKAKKDDEGEWEYPENLGGIINTAYDDLYYTFHTKTKNAYFISDRPGSICRNEKEDGLNCADIYQARIFVDLELNFFSLIGKKEVWNASVEMEDMDTGAIGELSTNNRKNHLQVRLEPGKTYLFKIKAPGYLDKTIEVNTEGFSYVASLEKEVLLEKKVTRP